VVGERGRGPVTNDGPHYPLPYAGEGAVFYSPASAGTYQPWLDEGFARLGARRTREEFEIASTWSGRSPGVTTLLLSLGSAAEVRSVAGLLA